MFISGADGRNNSEGSKPLYKILVAAFVTISLFVCTSRGHHHRDNTPPQSWSS
jgi:hypothetical protein